MRFPNDCRVFFFLSLLLFLLLLLFISTSSTVVREIHSEPIDFVRGSFRSVMDFFFFSFLFFFEGGGGGNLIGRIASDATNLPIGSFRP